VSGAGAAIQPSAAPAGGSARILRSLPDHSDGPDDPRSFPNGQADKNLVVTGPEANKGQAGRPSQQRQ